LLLCWFVVSGWNVTSKSRRRRRLTNALERANNDALPKPERSNNRGGGAGAGSVVPVRNNDRGASSWDRRALDLERVDVRSEVARCEANAGLAVPSGSRDGGGGGADVRVVVQDDATRGNTDPGDDEHDTHEISEYAEGAEGQNEYANSVAASDKDSAFDPVPTQDPRLATMLNYVRQELSAISGRYEGLMRGARRREERNTRTPRPNGI
jgi:hypothetical protein